MQDWVSMRTFYTHIKTREAQLSAFLEGSGQYCNYQEKKKTHDSHNHEAQQKACRLDDLYLHTNQSLDIRWKWYSLYRNQLRFPLFSLKCRSFCFDTTIQSKGTKAFQWQHLLHQIPVVQTHLIGSIMFSWVLEEKTHVTILQIIFMMPFAEKES